MKRVGGLVAPPTTFESLRTLPGYSLAAIAPGTREARATFDGARSDRPMTRSDDAREPRDTMDERSWMDLALASHVEPLARGRLVLFVGDPESAAAARLTQVAARVEVLSKGPRQRPSRSGRGTFRALADGRRWDLVWLADGTSLANEPSQLRDLAEALTPRGAALLVVDAGAVAYEEFYAALRSAFERVRMLGQAPFAGHAIVDFASNRSAAAPYLDDTLLDDTLVDDTHRQPARYVAVCGPTDVVLEPWAIVQVPTGPSATSAEARRDLEAARARLEHAERRLEQAQREIARSGQKLDELRHEYARARDELTRRSEDVEAERRRATELAERLEAVSHALDDALRSKDEMAALEAERNDLEAALEARAREILALRADLADRAILVRDLVEFARNDPALRESRQATLAVSASDADERRLREGLVIAQRRAVDAEAARAAAVFARDEALAEARAVAERARAESLARARDEGRARGLTARVAELEELRGQLEARLALASADLERLREDLRAARREAELRTEQYEVAVVRLHALERDVAARIAESSAGNAPMSTPREAGSMEAVDGTAESAEDTPMSTPREGQNQHQDDAAQTQAEREQLRAKAEALEVELEAARSRCSMLEAETLALRTRHDEFERANATRLDALRGEIAGLRRRLLDAEAAFDAVSRASAARLSETREALDRLTGAHQAALDLQRMAVGRADREAGRAHELAQRVLAMEALVARLQASLAQEAERAASARRTVSALEVRLTEAITERDALETRYRMRAEQDHAATERERDRADAAENQLRLLREVSTTLHDAARQARAVLAEASRSIPTDPGGIVGSEAIARQRIDELRAAVADRDLMLRSLTAQLQDKDDRIRALEAVLAGEGSSRSAVDEVALAERDERIARLRSELEEARARLERLGLEEAPAAPHPEPRRFRAVLDRDEEGHGPEERSGAREPDTDEMHQALVSTRRELEQILEELRSDAASIDWGARIGRLLDLVGRA